MTNMDEDALQVAQWLDDHWDDRWATRPDRCFCGWSGGPGGHPGHVTEQLRLAGCLATELR